MVPIYYDEIPRDVTTKYFEYQLYLFTAKADKERADFAADKCTLHDYLSTLLHVAEYQSMLANYLVHCMQSIESSSAEDADSMVSKIKTLVEKENPPDIYELNKTIVDQLSDPAYCKPKL